MPKNKTNRAAAKRFRITAKGHVAAINAPLEQELAKIIAWFRWSWDNASLKVPTLADPSAAPAESASPNPTTCEAAETGSTNFRLATHWCPKD